MDTNQHARGGKQHALCRMRSAQLRTNRRTANTHSPAIYNCWHKKLNTCFLAYCNVAPTKQFNVASAGDMSVLS